jgi:hypothetical protein
LGNLKLIIFDKIQFELVSFLFYVGLPFFNFTKQDVLKLIFGQVPDLDALLAILHA